MIIKRRSKPLVLKKLETVMSRLPPHFSGIAKLQSDITKRYKGYIGEQKVDYHMLQLLPPKFTLLQDVCLQVNSTKIQLDTIVITQHAIFIIEIKNYNGTLIFDTLLNQFTRSDGDRETGFRHPITQAENQQLHFISWLHERNLHHIPVHFLIAISDPSTIFKVIGDRESIAGIVGHGENIPGKIQKIDEKMSLAGRPSLDSRKIGKTIFQENQEFETNVLHKYGIKDSDILPGVQCPHCEHLGMVRRHKKWHCMKCGEYSKHAHLKTLSDYFLLFKPWITNKECVNFLQIHSRHVVSRLLKNSNLIYEPKTRRWSQNKTDQHDSRLKALK